jgi:hypothetical protein
MKPVERHSRRLIYELIVNPMFENVNIPLSGIHKRKAPDGFHPGHNY